MTATTSADVCGRVTRPEYAVRHVTGTAVVRRDRLSSRRWPRSSACGRHVAPGIGLDRLGKEVRDNCLLGSVLSPHTFESLEEIRTLFDRGYMILLSGPNAVRPHTRDLLIVEAEGAPPKLAPVRTEVLRETRHVWGRSTNESAASVESCAATEPAAYRATSSPCTRPYTSRLSGPGVVASPGVRLWSRETSALPGPGKITSDRSRVSKDIRRSSLQTSASSCSSVRGPTIGAVTRGLRSSQATATLAGVSPNSAHNCSYCSSRGPCSCDPLHDPRRVPSPVASLLQGSRQRPAC